jgi:hypothetical protein
MANTEKKSFMGLIMGVISIILQWIIGKKKIEKENEELKEQIKINEFNNTSENLENGYNKIESDKDKIINEIVTIEDLASKLNEKYK